MRLPCPRALVWVCALLAGTPLAAAPTAGVMAPDDKVVDLPPFVVTRLVFGPPWRYAEISGYEILSQCSDEETNDIIAALWHGPQLVLPPAMRPHFSLPMTVVLFNQPPTKTGSPPASDFAQLPGSTGPKWVKLIKRTLEDRESYAINVWPDSFDPPNTYRLTRPRPSAGTCPRPRRGFRPDCPANRAFIRKGVYWPGHARAGHRPAPRTGFFPRLSGLQERINASLQPAIR